jgi:protein phosphatase
MTLRFRAGTATDVGRVRDHNEDGFLVDDTLGLVAVADGMGGHNAGEVASAAALDALRIAFGAGATIDSAVTVANEIVYEQSVADRSLRGMGTTLTAGALGIDGTLTLGHVGDSRAYLVRDGRIDRVTTDHSLVDELIRAGELTEEEAERHPRRSQITRAIGLEPSVEVDVESVELRDGDRLLLCSDGLTTMVREPEILALVDDEPDPEQAAVRLVEAANAAGGADNITCVIIDITDDGEATPAAPPAPPAEVSDEDETQLVEAVDAEGADPPGADDEAPKRRRGLGRLFGRGK